MYKVIYTGPVNGSVLGHDYLKPGEVFVIRDPRTLHTYLATGVFKIKSEE